MLLVFQGEREKGSKNIISFYKVDFEDWAVEIHNTDAKMEA